MNKQSQILEAMLAALSVAKIRYLIGGSVAYSSIGVPRATLDTDILVEMASAQVELLARELGDEWYLDERLPRRRSRITALST